MHDDATMPTSLQKSADKLVWTTPRLELLGSMNDVETNTAQPPNDASPSPTVAAS